MLKSTLKKILIIFTSSIFALISFELFLRFSPFENGTSPMEYDKEIGMWHKKNHEGFIVKACYKRKYIFNEQGLPKNIYDYDTSKRDVILLGASYIEALMVENTNIIHNSLAKEFNGKYNFMNYALSGAGPTQEFIILKEKVNLENSKYVIQFIEIEGDLLDVDSNNLGTFARPKVYVEFDAIDEYQIIPPRDKKFLDVIGDFLGDYQIYTFIKTSLYHLKNNVFYQKGNSINKTIDNPQLKDLSKNWLYIKGAIHQVNKLIKSTSEKIEYKIIITSNNEQNKDILKEFLETENIDFIFLNDLVESMGIELKSFECDGHWNDETHRNIAKVIKESAFIN